jgi:hypothetical protein
MAVSIGTTEEIEEYEMMDDYYYIEIPFSCEPVKKKP